VLGAAGEETRWRSSGVPVACRGDGGGGASRRWQHALDRFRFTVGGMAAAPLNLVVRAVIPTSLLYVLCDRDPPTILGLGSPD